MPYEVSGNEVLSLVKSNFTLTGTLGLQASLLGLNSVVCPNYYSTDKDFILFKELCDLDKISIQCDAWKNNVELYARQTNVLSNLIKGSFEGDFFSFKDFGRKDSSDVVITLANNLGYRF